jgi:hypothetical protein
MNEEHQHGFGKEPVSAAATEVAVTDHRDLDSAAGRGLNHPALGANASPEVTHRFCRLPLVTFPHGPEAIHLGVLMRIRYGPGAREEIDLRQSFHEDSQGTERYKKLHRFLYVFRRLSPTEMSFKASATSKRKENSPRTRLPCDLPLQ